LIAEKIESLTQQELYKKNKQLTELSQTDQLTKLYNRRFILKVLNDELYRAKRYKTVFSIILFDIDHFKQVNDVFGHNAGDEVLNDISALVRKIVRTTDKVSRWGGEEFLILCTETDGKNAKILAEKIRKAVESYNFPIDRQVTISGGVAEYSNEDNISELIEKADEKLYQAKNSGRNKILI
jgi:two-component system cell cycle response regulator